jgi:hypothetical protein
MRSKGTGGETFWEKRERSLLQLALRLAGGVETQPARLYIGVRAEAKTEDSLFGRHPFFHMPNAPTRETGSGAIRILEKQRMHMDIALRPRRAIIQMQSYFSAFAASLLLYLTKVLSVPGQEAESPPVAVPYPTKH